MDVKSIIGFVLICMLSAIYFFVYLPTTVNLPNDSDKTTLNQSKEESQESIRSNPSLQDEDEDESIVKNRFLHPVATAKQEAKKDGFWVNTNVYRMHFSLKDAGIKNLFLKQYLDKNQKEIDAIFYPNTHPSGLSTHYISSFQSAKKHIAPHYQYAVYSTNKIGQDAGSEFQLQLNDKGNMQEDILLKTQEFVSKILSKKMQTRFKEKSLYSGPFKVVAFYTVLDASRSLSSNGKRHVGLLKVFSFREDKYFIDLDFQVENLSSSELTFRANDEESVNQGSWYIHWGRALGPGIPEGDEGKYYQKGRSDIIQVSYMNSETRELEEIEENQSRVDNFRWLGIDSRYLGVFLVQDWKLNSLGAKVWDTHVLKGEANFGKFVPSKWLGVFNTQVREKLDQEILGVQFPMLTLYPNEVKEFHLGVLVGTKSRFFLNQDGFDGFDFSYVRDRSWVPFIKPLEWFIEWLIFALYQWVPNFGLVIILVAIILKIIVYPLTKKTIESTRKMQKLSPQIKEIEKRYANNAQQKQIAIMELYKREKVNPLKGCLPLLLQLPIFFAMWQVLPSLIELKNVNFLWIQDLSAPDTVMYVNLILTNQINILPLIMAATSFIQMKFTPQTQQGGEAAQRAKTMQIMLPIILLFVFWSMPSGMVLYWTVQNILQILQEIYVRLNFKDK